MNYLVKNAQGEIFKLTVVSGVPQLPEGMELVGEESIINPLGLDLSICAIQDVELQAEQRILLRAEQLAQVEVLAQDAILDANNIEIAPAVPYQTAVPYQAAIWNVIPAIRGKKIVEDSTKVSVARQVKANDVLNQIRNLREPLLIQVDRDINIAEDNGIDTVALRTYRKELRACTDVLKKVNGDAKLSCEVMIPAEFVFPIKL